uniref:Uncharacterized protein n=1 Tax=Leersia perrieri TaxID=77586 RepID=A0A0D9WC85_9ORYZ
MELQANSKTMKRMHKGAMKTDLDKDDGQVVDESTKALLDPWNPYFPSWPDIPPNLGPTGTIRFIKNVQ